jgi:hypothetical protein
MHAIYAMHAMYAMHDNGAVQAIVNARLLDILMWRGIVIAIVMRSWESGKANLENTLSAWHCSTLMSLYLPRTTII